MLTEQHPLQNPNSTMPTLAQTIETTTPVSPLLRKARRIGIRSVDDMIALAASRGCSHYMPGLRSVPVSADELGDEELTILLIVGENPYEPTAIRCAAQLARSRLVNPAKLARLALMEKCEREAGGLIIIFFSSSRHDRPSPPSPLPIKNQKSKINNRHSAILLPSSHTASRQESRPGEPPRPTPD